MKKELTSNINIFKLGDQQITVHINFRIFKLIFLAIIQLMFTAKKKNQTLKENYIQNIVL